MTYSTSYQRRKALENTFGFNRIQKCERSYNSRMRTHIFSKKYEKQNTVLQCISKIAYTLLCISRIGPYLFSYQILRVRY